MGLHPLYGIWYGWPERLAPPLHARALRGRQVKDKDICRCGECGAWKLRARLCRTCEMALVTESLTAFYAKRAA